MSNALDQFDGALRARTPRAWVTPALIAINCALFVATLALSGDTSVPDSRTLLAFGAISADRVLAGEHWRLLAGAFLHGGWPHLAFNMLALFQVGLVVERLFGNFWFALLYLSSALAGAAASVWWKQDIISVGASGAVFGVYGALLAYLALDRGSIPRSVLQHLSGATILFVGYSLASGFGQAGIDNAAHVGGLLAGLALGAAAARPLGLAGWSPLRFGRAALGLAVVAAVVLLLVRGTPEPNLEARESQRLNAAVQELAREDDAVDALMIDLRGRIDRGEVGGEQAVDILERDIVPRWNRQIEALGAIRVRAADRRALREQLIRYASLRRDAARGAVQAIRDDDPRKAEAARRKYEQSQRIIVELLRKAPAN